MPEGRAQCHCCGEILSKRTIRRHHNKYFVPSTREERAVPFPRSRHSPRRRRKKRQASFEESERPYRRSSASIEDSEPARRPNLEPAFSKSIQTLISSAQFTAEQQQRTAIRIPLEDISEPRYANDSISNSGSILTLKREDRHGFSSRYDVDDSSIKYMKPFTHRHDDARTYKDLPNHDHSHYTGDRRSSRSYYD